MLTDIYVSDDEHNHVLKEPMLPLETKKFVEALFLDGTRKPSEIIRKIKEKDLKQLKTIQLKNLWLLVQLLVVLVN
jgi:hypothetical protein